MSGRENKDKKQVLLRLPSSLWEDLVGWADDDIRSLNGQIEYLLSDAVRRRKRERHAQD
ncbi:MAG: Arc family DNA-binding protein [Coriobacteriia bacterium]|nr:Arc family DNA-binding protein [Coriobacteriia bacterium]